MYLQMRELERRYELLASEMVTMDDVMGIAAKMQKRYQPVKWLLIIFKQSVNSIVFWMIIDNHKSNSKSLEDPYLISCHCAFKNAGVGHGQTKKSKYLK